MWHVPPLVGFHVTQVETERVLVCSVAENAWRSFVELHGLAVKARRHASLGHLCRRQYGGRFSDNIDRIVEAAFQKRTQQK